MTVFSKMSVAVALPPSGIMATDNPSYLQSYQRRHGYIYIYIYIYTYINII